MIETWLPNPEVQTRVRNQGGYEGEIPLGTILLAPKVFWIVIYFITFSMFFAPPPKYMIDSPKKIFVSPYYVF